jgi:UDP-GlcNAc:undecaprenyl-phosphate GlcNAc-1-phosphate transferase
MMTTMLTAAIIAFLISFIGTVLVKRMALVFGAVDRPVLKRKVHKVTTPRLGGVAIFTAIVLVLGVLIFFHDMLTSGQITHLHYLGYILGGLVLMIGGILDDRYDLPARFTIFPPIIAAVVLIGFGVEIEKLTNPLGGVLYLEAWQSDLLVFAWLMVVMYTTKFLDGLDGLATSVSTVGAVMMMLLSMTVVYFQPDVALFAAIVIGAQLGFLFWNFHPASIFLGEGGSTFVGFTLGTLAVISGGKLATALLVLGIPLMDLIWVALRRWRTKGFKNMFKGDRKHLHHRLLDLGWTQHHIFLFYTGVATLFGITTLFLQSKEKIVALVVLIFFMLLMAAFLVQQEKKSYDTRA